MVDPHNKAEPLRYWHENLPLGYVEAADPIVDLIDDLSVRVPILKPVTYGFVMALVVYAAILELPILVSNLIAERDLLEFFLKRVLGDKITDAQHLATIFMVPLSILSLAAFHQFLLSEEERTNSYTQVTQGLSRAYNWFFQSANQPQAANQNESEKVLTGPALD